MSCRDVIIGWSKKDDAIVMRGGEEIGGNNRNTAECGGLKK